MPEGARRRRVAARCAARKLGPDRGNALPLREDRTINCQLPNRRLAALQSNSVAHMGDSILKTKNIILMAAFGISNLMALNNAFAEETPSLTASACPPVLTEWTWVKSGYQNQPFPPTDAKNEEFVAIAYAKVVLACGSLPKSMKGIYIGDRIFALSKTPPIIAIARTQLKL